LYRRLGGPHSRSGRGGEEENVQIVLAERGLTKGLLCAGQVIYMKIHPLLDQLFVAGMRRVVLESGFW